MASLQGHVKWLYREFGLDSLWLTGRDAWLLIFARSARMFAYGATSLILALFFSSLEFSDFKIGLFFSLTLLGDVFLSFVLTLVADQVGRRLILLLGSVLMIFSGAAFALFDNFWVLLLAAVVGVLSASGGDMGPFRSIEESTLSHLTSPKTRSDVLAWYITSASLGSAAGTLLAGQVAHRLQGRKDWRDVDAYHAIFWVYVVMGLFNMFSTLMLGDNVEAERPREKPSAEEEGEGGQESAEGLLQGSSSQEDGGTATVEKKSLFTQISAETRSVMYKLWFLLIIDSLADGMVSYSLTTYFIDQKFHLDKSTLGDITSVSYLLSSISTIFAAPLARRLGLINTMVFTHLPSSLAVLFFPFPNNVPLMVILFFIRTGLNNMDQAPRAAFIAAVVKPEERTAVMGITATLRTMASTCGPTVTGLLASNDRFWIAYVAAGIFRICYDLGLWFMFVNMKLHQHEEGDKHEGERIDDGETIDDDDDDEELRDFPRGGGSSGKHVIIGSS